MQRGGRQRTEESIDGRIADKMGVDGGIMDRYSM